MMVALAVGTLAVIVLMILIGFSSSRRRKQHGFNALPGEKRSEK